MTTQATRFTWCLAAGGPLLVAAGLVVFHSAWAVFLVYHLGVCLVAPAWWNLRREGLSWRQHAGRLGLAGNRGVASGLALGVALGIVAAFLIYGAFLLLPAWFPDPSRLRSVLSGWNLDPERPGGLLAFLALVNGPAEELFWRGFAQDRLIGDRGWRTTRLLRIGALFVSYHAVTIGALAPSLAARALMLAGVALAAAVWVWTRYRWASVWPALLSHAGASVGYVAVCARLLQQS